MPQYNQNTAIGNFVNINDNLGAKFRNQVELLMNKYASDANDLLLEPTKTWNNHKVVFSREVRREGNRIYNVVYADSDVYFWLNYGTSKRFAILSRDWQSKTSVRSLTAEAGSGQVVGLARVPFDGIKAREWTQVVEERLQPDFITEMQRVAFEAANVRTR